MLYNYPILPHHNKTYPESKPKNKINPSIIHEGHEEHEEHEEQAGNAAACMHLFSVFFRASLRVLGVLRGRLLILRTASAPRGSARCPGPASAESADSLPRLA